ncbi:MAG TPA: O-antigen ligase family protein [Salinivirgaceae bacterium]|nr:O-antigen ligase family protein [Salinivirgaceae bacterium]
MFGLLIIVASLPSSPYFTSIGQWILALAWLADKNLITKAKGILKNKTLIAFLSFYILHVLSLLWTTDYQYGLHDLKIKLPFLILPLIVATSAPLNKKELKTVLWIFSLSVFVVSQIGLYTVTFTEQGQAADFREMSRFISHIRFSLMLNLSIVTLLFIAFENRQTKAIVKVICVVLSLYFVFFILIMKSLTGIVILGVLFLLLFIYLIKKVESEVGRWVLYIFLTFFILFSVSYVVRSYAKYSYRADEALDKLEKTTINGNLYKHNTASSQRENGFLVNINVCQKELKQEWNKIANIHYDSLGASHYKVKYTLIRYLTSKGLTKDSVGISKLTMRDIAAIENGITNYIFLDRFSLYPRLYELFWEYEHYRSGGQIGGQSVIQRLYYIEAGWNIFLDNKIIGVGVGDVKSAYDEYYTTTESPLKPAFRLRAHNQYLTFLLTFGIVGIIIIIFSQFYPAYKLKKQENLSVLFTPFMIIVLLSMLNEDSLETQAGATFYAFFYSLFTWGLRKPKIKS